MKARATLADDILRLVAEHQDKLVGRFVVLQPGRIRFTEPPPGDERN
jgi:hypothetical protein